MAARTTPRRISIASQPKVSASPKPTPTPPSVPLPASPSSPGATNYSPRQSGYDHFWGFRTGALDYFTHQGEIRNVKIDDLWDGDTPIHQRGYLTGLLGDRAIASIHDYAKARTPFLLSLHFNAPHWPWEGPGDEEKAAHLTSLGAFDDGNLATYGAIVQRLDFQIGRVLKALDTAGIAGNTIVIFTSDNGGEPPRR